MRGRPLLLAVVAALVVAAPAAAVLPVFPSGSSVGDGLPLKAYASLTPPVHLFGDAVTARLAVVADTRLVDPRRLSVQASFAPYLPEHPVVVAHIREGRFEQVTWTWTLRCLTSPCVPRPPPSDETHVFRFPPAHVDYLARDGRRAYGITAGWPKIEVSTQINPAVQSSLAVRGGGVPWRFHLTPVPAAGYRIAPRTLFVVALALAGLLGVAALLLARRWLVAIWPRKLPPAPVFSPSATPLERALVLLSWARQHDDETLQRKALERVADELGEEIADVEELARRARELAWSSQGPAEADVETFSEQARERGHHEEAAPKEPV